VVDKPLKGQSDKEQSHKEHIYLRHNLPDSLGLHRETHGFWRIEAYVIGMDGMFALYPKTESFTKTNSLTFVNYSAERSITIYIYPIIQQSRGGYITQGANSPGHDLPRNLGRIEELMVSRG